MRSVALKMKGVFTVVSLGCFLALAFPATALTVLQNGAAEKVVLDSVSGNMWYWNLSTFAGHTYAEQLAQIQQLNAGTYFDSAQWHLASRSEMQQLWTQNTDLIRQTFQPSQERYEGAYQWHYWSGRFEDGTGGIHSATQTAFGNFAFGPWNYAWPEIMNLSDVGGYPESGAWVVALVPEPSTGGFLVLGIGFMAVRSICRRPKPGIPGAA